MNKRRKKKSYFDFASISSNFPGGCQKIAYLNAIFNVLRCHFGFWIKPREPNADKVKSDVIEKLLANIWLVYPFMPSLP